MCEQMTSHARGGDTQGNHLALGQEHSDKHKTAASSLCLWTEADVDEITRHVSPTRRRPRPSWSEGHLSAQEHPCSRCVTQPTRTP